MNDDNDNDIDIPQWVLESEKELGTLPADLPLLHSPRQPEEYMKFEKKFCEADRYAPVNCRQLGPLRVCGHYICCDHYYDGEYGIGYANSLGEYQHCEACAGILNTLSYKLAKWFRISTRKQRFRKSVAQIKIARWWRYQLFITAVNSQPNLTRKRDQILDEQRQREETIRKERETREKGEKMKSARLAWLSRLESQN